MGNDIHVIESDDYRNEEEELKKDPIIIQMTEEVKEVDEAQVDWNEFVNAAGVEYKRRGGTKAWSIGGPARAIRSLLNDREDKTDD